MERRGYWASDEVCVHQVGGGPTTVHADANKAGPPHEQVTFGTMWNALHRLEGGIDNTQQVNCDDKEHTSGVNSGNSVLLRIAGEDSGIGIDPEIIMKSRSHLS